MRRAPAVLAGLAAAALVLAPPAAGGDRPPSRLLVTASEWNLVLSRGAIDRGAAIVQMYNRGEDPHNLRIQRRGGGAVRRIVEQEPGGTGQVEMRFRKGARYRFWCSLEGHEELGMKATLKVRRRAGLRAPAAR